MSSVAGDGGTKGERIFGFESGGARTHLPRSGVKSRPIFRGAEDVGQPVLRARDKRDGGIPWLEWIPSISSFNSIFPAGEALGRPKFVSGISGGVRALDRLKADRFLKR